MEKATKLKKILILFLMLVESANAQDLVRIRPTNISMDGRFLVVNAEITDPKEKVILIDRIYKEHSQDGFQEFDLFYIRTKIDGNRDYTEVQIRKEVRFGTRKIRVYGKHLKDFKEIEI